MAANDVKQSVSPQVLDGPTPAPIIFFDFAPASAGSNGVIGITLAAVKHLPVNGGVMQQCCTVGHLRCSISTAIELRKALDTALLLAQRNEIRN